jgi:hypothetical protein
MTYWWWRPIMFSHWNYIIYNYPWMVSSCKHLIYVFRSQISNMRELSSRFFIIQSSKLRHKFKKILTINRDFHIHMQISHLYQREQGNDSIQLQLEKLVCLLNLWLVKGLRNFW